MLAFRAVSRHKDTVAKETIELTRAVIPIPHAAGAARFIGDAVSVEGVAVDHERSAGVERADLFVHLLELPAWPDDVLGKTVKAYGELGRKGEGDDAFFFLSEFRYEVAGDEAASDTDLPDAD